MRSRELPAWPGPGHPRRSRLDPAVSAPAATGQATRARRREARHRRGELLDAALAGALLDADQIPRRDGLIEAAQRHLHRRHHGLNRRMHALRHQDLPRRRDLAEALGQQRRRADRRVLPAPLGPDPADRRVARATRRSPATARTRAASRPRRAPTRGRATRGASRTATPAGSSHGSGSFSTTVTASPASRASVPPASSTSAPDRRVVGGQHAPSRPRARRSRRTPANPCSAADQHRDLAAVALQHGRVGLDELRDLGREEALQAGGVALDLVVVALDPQQRPHPRRAAPRGRRAWR